MARATQGELLAACDELLAAAKTNAGKPDVDELRVQLEKDTGTMREARARRNVHKAAAQQSSRDLDAAVKSAKVIYSRLKHMLIALYGLSSETLVQYGLQPFRPAAPTDEQRTKRFLKKQTPTEPGVAPTRTADSQTESTS
jgi:hypothetical protein